MHTIDLTRFDRRRYTDGPTPLIALERFSEVLGGPNIFIKRDDCLGLLGGGNKTRKLEFVVADAMAQGADTLITCGAVQSNHCRLTASAASLEGLECRLVLEERVPGSYDPDASGNNFLYRLLGVEHFEVVPGGTDMNAAMEKMAEEARGEGRKPYLIPVGARMPLGALGYVDCANEIIAQSQQMGIAFDAILHATGGSAGTQAGLLIGLSALEHKPEVIGICSGADTKTQSDRVISLFADTLELLSLPSSVNENAIICCDEYVGPGYSIPTPEMAEAVQLLAHSEALLLDPVYSGKAMAGLIDQVRQGRFSSDQNVLFVHTGGVPAIYHYSDDVLGGLPK